MTRPATLPADPSATTSRRPVEARTPASLPQWAQSLEARILLSTILADPPAVRVYDNGFSRFGGEEYCGREAARLRGLFKRGLRELVDAETAAYRAGRDCRALTDAVQAYLLAEKPDALIARLLRERGL